MQKNVDKWITFVDNLLIKGLFAVEKLWISLKKAVFQGKNKNAELCINGCAEKIRVVSFRFSIEL